VGSECQQVPALTAGSPGTVDNAQGGVIQASNKQHRANIERRTLPVEQMEVVFEKPETTPRQHSSRQPVPACATVRMDPPRLSNWALRAYMKKIVPPQEATYTFRRAIESPSACEN
jgi:hypothetical protein